MSEDDPGRPIRVRASRLYYAHFGGHSGFGQLLAYLTELGVSVQDRPYHARRLGAGAGTSRRLFRRLGSDLELAGWPADLTTLPGGVARRFDVLHVLDAESFLRGSLWSAFADRLGVRQKTIATYHQPPSVLADFLPTEGDKVLEIAVGLCEMQCDYLREKFPGRRVCNIPHGIDQSFFTPGRREPPSRRPLRVLTVGGWLRDFETFEAVAEQGAARRLAEFHYVGSESVARRLSRVCHAHSGFSDERLREAYRKADVVFLPLKDATANNALLEAMACGVPVVATDLPAIREYAGPDAAILFAPGSVEGALEAIDTASDPERWQTMSRAGVERAESMRWPEVARRYVELYRELAAD